jgi:hypothetical protein
MRGVELADISTMPRLSSSSSSHFTSASASPKHQTALYLNSHAIARPLRLVTMALSVDQKRLKATKFPPEFDQKVDNERVNIDLMKKWIAQKMASILGDEDDVVIETCYNMLEQNRFVCPSVCC